MANSFNSEDISAFTPRADTAYRKIATNAANQELQNRPTLNFMWSVMMIYGLPFAFSLVICLGNTTPDGQIRWIPLMAMIGLLLLTCLGLHYLVKRFMQRIDRLILLTKRIATGDLSPILPISRFRDEFTAVNVAMNQMIEELDAWHSLMEESHQLTAIGTLTAGVAHEINNPLNNIMLTALTLQEDYKDLSEIERDEMIGDLIQETERAQNIVRNLQDFARESQSTSGIHDLGALVEETTEIASNQARRSGSKIRLNIQKYLPCIRGDRQKLKQVFMNLILNALDAAGKEGEIKISVEKGAHPGFLAVHVEDNGPGIPRHVLPFIFDPFFTTKPPGKRTGLGLSVSQGIVTQHGGRIDVTSQEGKFTRFTILIPSTDASSGKGQSNAGPSRNENITDRRV